MDEGNKEARGHFFYACVFDSPKSIGEEGGRECMTKGHPQQRHRCARLPRLRITHNKK